MATFTLVTDIIDFGLNKTTGISLTLLTSGQEGLIICGDILIILGIIGGLFSFWSKRGGDSNIHLLKLILEDLASVAFNTLTIIYINSNDRTSDYNLSIISATFSYFILIFQFSTTGCYKSFQQGLKAAFQCCIFWFVFIPVSFCMVIFVFFYEKHSCE